MDGGDRRIGPDAGPPEGLAKVSRWMADDDCDRTRYLHAWVMVLSGKLEVCHLRAFYRVPMFIRMFLLHIPHLFCDRQL